MIAQINMRKGTSAEWAAASPVILLAGESGYDTTLKRYKVGDGETEWANLEWNTLWSRPVGSIYMSISDTSPASLFGGTWSAIPSGRSIRTGIGGEESGSDTVTLSSSHIPSMDIPIFVTGYGWLMSSTYVAPQEDSGWIGLNPGGATPSLSGAHAVWGNTPSAFSVVPKSYHVYAWIRTA